MTGVQTCALPIYQLWRTGDDSGAMRWVLVNIALSALFLLALNLLETRQQSEKKGGGG